MTDIVDQLESFGVSVELQSAAGLEAKIMKVPAGIRVGKEIHSFDHFSVLLSGKVAVDVAGQEVIYDKPTLILIKAGQEHVITAITDVHWICIHAVANFEGDL